MHKLTQKRQVTVPKMVCNELGLQPGDMVEIFARDGVAHLVRMSKGSLAGRFADLINDQKIPSPETVKKAVKKRATQKFKQR